VTSIDYGAFAGCTNLSSVTIPKSVTSIGYNAFATCDDLTIMGKFGSYAHEYARRNDIPFIKIVGEKNSIISGDITLETNAPADGLSVEFILQPVIVKEETYGMVCRLGETYSIGTVEFLEGESNKSYSYKATDDPTIDSDTFLMYMKIIQGNKTNSIFYRADNGELKKTSDFFTYYSNYSKKFLEHPYDENVDLDIYIPKTEYAVTSISGNVKLKEPAPAGGLTFDFVIQGIGGINSNYGYPYYDTASLQNLGEITFEEGETEALYNFSCEPPFDADYPNFAIYLRTDLNEITNQYSVIRSDGKAEYVRNISSKVLNDEFENVKQYQFGTNIIQNITFGEKVNACGDNLNWTFDKSTKTLTVSGTGVMYDYTTSSRPSWNIYKDEIEKVVFLDGVTYIGDYAFVSYGALQSVYIPDTINEIGSYAFGYCENITSLTVKNCAVKYDTSAFCNVSNLTACKVVSVGDNIQFETLDEKETYIVSKSNVLSDVCVGDILVLQIIGDTILVEKTQMIRTYATRLYSSSYQLQLNKYSFYVYFKNDIQGINIPEFISVAEDVLGSENKAEYYIYENKLLYAEKVDPNVVFLDGEISLDKAPADDLEIKLILQKVSMRDTEFYSPNKYFIETSSVSTEFVVRNGNVTESYSLNVQRNETPSQYVLYIAPFINGEAKGLFYKNKSGTIMPINAITSTYLTDMAIHYNYDDLCFDFKLPSLENVSSGNLLSTNMQTGVFNQDLLIPYSEIQILSDSVWQQQLAFNTKTYTLSGNLSKFGENIKTQENASGFVVGENISPYSIYSSYVLIDEEIILVEKGTSSGFINVKRGQLGTQATNHDDGAVIKQLLGWNKGFLPMVDSELYIKRTTTFSKTSGDIFEIPLSIYNNAGISKMELNITCPDGIELVNAVNGTAFSSLTMNPCDSVDKNSYKINWSGTDNNCDNGTFVTLSFKTDNIISEGDYVIEFEISATNVNLENVDVSDTVSKITIRNFIEGDCNGNETVTIDDAIYLAFYTFYHDRYPIPNGMDVDFNNDGEVTIDDAIYLAFYTFYPDRYPLN
jgi:hypothetical protein